MGRVALNNQAAKKSAGKTISLAEAIAIAEKQSGGKTVKAELKTEDGATLFKIETRKGDEKSKVVLGADGKPVGTKEEEKKTGDEKKAPPKKEDEKKGDEKKDTKKEDEGKPNTVTTDLNKLPPDLAKALRKYATDSKKPGLSAKGPMTSESPFSATNLPPGLARTPPATRRQRQWRRGCFTEAALFFALFAVAPEEDAHYLAVGANVDCDVARLGAGEADGLVIPPLGVVVGAGGWRGDGEVGFAEGLADFAGIAADEALLKLVRREG